MCTRKVHITASAVIIYTAYLISPLPIPHALLRLRIFIYMTLLLHKSADDISRAGFWHKQYKQLLRAPRQQGPQSSIQLISYEY